MQTRRGTSAVRPPPPSPPVLWLTRRAAVGLIILFYDHLLTFADEVRLVWRAPRSFPKYAFLFNKYLVLANLLAIAHGESRSWRGGMPD